MAHDSEIPADAPRPRLSHMVKRDDFNGYGFNLHAQKNRPGQFIGVVDAGSPAEVAGLKEGDRIIEVNGTNIANENHRQVVERIKAIPNETSLLVVDKVTEDYYRKLDIIVSKDLPNVERRSSSNAKVESHAEPDSGPEVAEVASKTVEVSSKVATFKIEEEDDEEEGVEEESSYQRRLSSRSSTTSTDKAAHDDDHFPEIPKEILNAAQHSEEHIEAQVVMEQPSEVEEVTKKVDFERETNEEQEKIDEQLLKMEQEEEERKIKEREDEEKEQFRKIAEEKKQKEEEEREEQEERRKKEEEEVKLQKEKEERDRRMREELEREMKRKEEFFKEEKEDSEKTLSIGSESGSSVRSTPSPQPREAKQLIPAASPATPTSPVSPTSGGASNWDGLNLNMTAAEMREMIGAKKKKDPRKDKSLDFRKKFEIIQTL